MVAYGTRIDLRAAFGVVSWMLASSAALVACSGEDGARGSSCTVTQDDAQGVTTIECDDGTSAEVSSGGGASSCSVEDNDDGTKAIRCDDGTEVEVSDGADGDDGAPGADGDDGAPGEDGDDGAPGADGPSGDAGPSGRSSQVVGPGLVVAITEVEIPSDRRPIVTLSLRDAQGRPLDRSGGYTQGAISARFVIAYLASSSGVVGQYVPYKTSVVSGKTVDAVPPVLPSATQPGSDSTGTWTELDPTQGTYSYRFEAALPSGFPTTKTHTVAGYLSRTVDGVAYAADPVFHFRPDDEDVTELREIVTTETCNKCHDTLAVHGGSRRDTALCITCHVEGMADPETGNSLDFKQMVHKIHRGKNLPSVLDGDPYTLVGYNDTLHDYSTVQFPQAMENCTTCHQGAPDSDRWKTAISRAACTSCHDRTNFATTTPPGFTDHFAGDYATDDTCLGCHSEGDNRIGPFEVDVTKVHVPRTDLPYRQVTNSSGADYGDVLSEAPELTGEILEVTDVDSGDNPKVRFSVAVDGVPRDVLSAPLGTLRFTFAAPTIDYQGYAQVTPASVDIASAGPAGEFIWTSPTTMGAIASGGTIPFALSGTLAVGMEGRISAPATAPNGTPIASVNHAMHNQVFYVAITDAVAVPRREATTVEKCNTCHYDLEAHGGSRNDPEYCVLCHSAKRDTISRMPVPPIGEVARTTSLRMSHMVHAIHSGEDREHAFVGYNNSNAPIDFGEVRFPGDRRNCEHCHVEDQYQIPLAEGLLASRTSDIDDTRARVGDYFVGATAAACVGCHDSDSTAVHVATMSLITPPASPGELAEIDEACATCHASGREFGLDQVHARPGL